MYAIRSYYVLVIKGPVSLEKTIEYQSYTQKQYYQHHRHLDQVMKVFVGFQVHSHRYRIVCNPFP